MIFREIREDLLKISINDFASDYGVPISVVEELERTNEVPISLIRMISKKSGYSVGDLIKYDGSQKLQETNKTSSTESPESNIPSFSVAEKETVGSQFNDWLKDNKQSLAYSQEIETWAKESIGWILDEYDKSQLDSVPDNEKITAKDIEDYSERMASVSLNEIKRLQFILNNRNRSQIIIKNAVNLEVTRLMTEDSILAKKTNDLSVVKDNYLKETHSLLEKMTSYQHIEEALKKNVFEDYFYGELLDGINRACIKKQEEFRDSVDSVVYEDDGLIQFYKAELSGLFEEATELNGFSVEDIYYKYFRYGLSHPEDFGIVYTEVTEEEKGKREKATKKRRTKEAAWDFATDMLFPPKAIMDVFKAGNKRNTAKEMSKFLKEHRIVDDYYNRMSYCYNVVVTSAEHAMKGIKKDWKKYFDGTIDLVQKDDRTIKRMIEDEKKKVFISKALKEAFQEEK